MSSTASPKAPLSWRLHALRAHYFFAFGALGALFPFLPLILSGRGLSRAQISLVMVLLPIANLLVPPLFGLLADRFRIRIRLLQLAGVGCGLATLLLIPRRALVGTAAAFGAVSFFRAPMTTLADAAVFSEVGQRSGSYSTVRVWGSVGFVVLVLAVGQLAGARNPTVTLLWTATLYVLSGAAVVALREPVIGSASRSLLGAVQRALGERPLLWLLVGNACYYAAHSSYDVYYGIHLRSLGFGDRVVGGSWALGVAAEIVAMTCGPRLLRQAGARTGLLQIASAVAAGRWLAISLVHSRSLAILVQASHGITFGVWYPAMVAFAQRSAPEALRTSVQSAATAAIGLGTVVGYLGGGQVYEHLGGATMFRLASVASLLAALAYGAAGHACAPTDRTA